MWNWKSIYEDDKFAFYSDIDNIIDSEGDEDGIYASVECYQPMPPRVVVWVAFVFKKKLAISHYIKQREGMGLPTKGYQKYKYTLSLVEIDAEKKQYRVIPAIDYDGEGNQLGASSILMNETKPLIKGIKTEWSPLHSRGTHKAIPALYKLIYP
jgi:hypothetical protein